MNLSLNSRNVKTNDFFPMELQVACADIPERISKAKRAQFKTLDQTRREIRFEIDQALPPNSDVSIKMAKRPSEKKRTGEVFKVHRGRIQYCNEIKGLPGPRYEVGVQILETVIQTEILSSRFNFN